MKYDVTALGELLIDFSCEKLDEMGYPTMAAHPGGAPANFLCTLQKFGAQTALISQVGKDTFGEKLISTMQREGVDVEGIVTDEETFTTLAFVTLDEKGNREFSFARKPGADTRLSRERILWEKIDHTRIFHFGTLSLTHEPARTATMTAVMYAREQGKLLTFDPNLRKPLWQNLEEAKRWILWGLEQADVVKISDEEVEFLFGDMSLEDAAEKMLLEYSLKVVFITMGEQGCFYSNGTVQGRVPALSGIRSVDTTGAGDIFGGAAVYQLLSHQKNPESLNQKELMEVVRFASVAAGLSTTKYGGISSIPSLEEVNERLRVFTF